MEMDHDFNANTQGSIFNANNSGAIMQNASGSTDLKRQDSKMIPMDIVSYI
jgi:hypothetical protein